MALKGLTQSAVRAIPTREVPTREASVDPSAPIPSKDLAKLSFGVHPDMHMNWKRFAMEEGVSIQSLIEFAVNELIAHSTPDALGRLKAAHKAKRDAIRTSRLKKVRD